MHQFAVNLERINPLENAIYLARYLSKIGRISNFEIPFFVQKKITGEILLCVSSRQQHISDIIKKFSQKHLVNKSEIDWIKNPKNKNFDFFWNKQI